MTKEEAQVELGKPLYDPQELEDDKAFWIKKLGITEVEYNQVMSEKPMFYTDFANNEQFLALLKSTARKVSRVYRAFRPKR